MSETPASLTKGRAGVQLLAGNQAAGRAISTAVGAERSVIRRASNEEIEAAEKRVVAALEQLDESSTQVAGILALFQLVDELGDDPDYFDDGRTNLMFDIVNKIDALEETLPEAINKHAQTLRLIIEKRNWTAVAKLALRGQEDPELKAQWLAKRVGHLPWQFQSKFAERNQDILLGLADAYVKNVAAEKTARPDEEVAKEISVSVSELVAKSKHIPELVSKTLSLDELRASIRILGEEDFTALAIRTEREKNAHLGDDPLIEVLIASDVDRIDGFEFEDTVFLRRGLVTLETTIHEAIHHMDKSRSFKKGLGHALNEGMTQLLTLMVLEEGKSKEKSSAYVQEVLLVKQVMLDCAFDLPAMTKAYFVDPKPLLARVLEIKGQPGVAYLLKARPSPKLVEGWTAIEKL